MGIQKLNVQHVKSFLMRITGQNIWKAKADDMQHAKAAMMKSRFDSINTVDLISTFNKQHRMGIQKLNVQHVKSLSMRSTGHDTYRRFVHALVRLRTAA
jgi:hypothetical protein